MQENINNYKDYSDFHLSGMAIVGDPPILLLDEMTAGMTYFHVFHDYVLILRMASTGLDPENKQTVWTVIQRLKQPDRLILLTTHSMEEAEVLCSRVGILAQGSLRCVGTPTNLKMRFGQGYKLTVNVDIPKSSLSLEQKNLAASESIARIDHYVHNEIGKHKSELVYAVNHTRRFMIPTDACSLSTIFEKMEEAKGVLGIREWAVAQASLEEVFIAAVTEAE